MTPVMEGTAKVDHGISQATSSDPAALLDSIRELRSLAAYQESAREEERTRISREIHDLLGQDLTALKLDLAWMRQRIPAGHEALARKVDSMSSLVDSTAKAVRRISRQLRPACSTWGRPCDPAAPRRRAGRVGRRGCRSCTGGP